MTRDYYCRDCNVGVGPLTQDQALELIARGHDVLTRPEPLPVSDALGPPELVRYYLSAAFRAVPGLRG